MNPRQTRPDYVSLPACLDGFVWDERTALYVRRSSPEKKPKWKRFQFCVNTVTVVALIATVWYSHKQLADSHTANSYEHRAVLATAHEPESAVFNQVKIPITNKGHAEATIVSVKGILSWNAYGNKGDIATHFKSPDKLGLIPPTQEYYLIATVPPLPAYVPGKFVPGEGGWSATISVDVKYKDGYETLRDFNTCIAFNPHKNEWQYGCADGALLNFVVPTAKYMD